MLQNEQSRESIFIIFVDFSHRDMDGEKRKCGFREPLVGWLDGIGCDTEIESFKISDLCSTCSAKFDLRRQVSDLARCTDEAEGDILREKLRKSIEFWEMTMEVDPEVIYDEVKSNYPQHDSFICWYRSEQR